VLRRWHSTVGLPRQRRRRERTATTDLRAVLKGLLAEHLGLADCVLSTQVFPDSAAVKPLRGLIA
jgi:uncharacterized protein (DUF1501 family)